MEIIFAGASHYGLAGYKSIQKFFDKIYLVKDNSQEILCNKRSQDELIDDFSDVECQIVFLCGYSKLISKEQLEKKTYINIHGALLPKYRGMHSTFYAIMNGERELGITFHLVNEYMDAGDILAQYCFEYNGQIVDDINKKIDCLVEKYAGEVCQDYINGLIIPQEQDNSIATFGARRNIDDCLIDFNMNNELLKRFFKALTYPYPRPMLNIHGEKYEIVDEPQIEYRNYYGPIGRVVYKDDLGVWINVREGFLIVKNVRKFQEDKQQLLENLVNIGYRFKQ